jgi:SAM-dependent methyltransferase
MEAVLGRIPLSLRDKVVIDFGCRYGLLFPLLIELGAKKVYGIEDLNLFFEPGTRLFHPPDWNVEFVRSDQGYIPLQPGTADLVIVNEVISHINSTYLPTVYSEICRLLTPRGILFISDGNNLGCTSYHSGYLTTLYEAIENGPDGAKVGDVTVQVCFMNQRKNIIRSRHPEMSQEQIEYAARNTSGLFGDYFYKVIDRFAQTGELICRPYRRGITPVYPESGQVEERGFYPEQVVFDLMEYGFESTIANQAYRVPYSSGRFSLESALMEPASGYAGFSYQVPVPKKCEKGVQLGLLEDGNPLPFPTDNHSEISEKGMGRYSIWMANSTIYFSSSDNSDPRLNGKSYELYWTRGDNKAIYGSPNFQIIAVKRH